MNRSRQSVIRENPGLQGHQARRSNAEKRNSRYWWQQRQIKKAQKARKERGSPVQAGGFKPDYIASYKAQRMKERYRDRLKGPKR